MKRNRTEAGQSVVEWSIVLPALLLLLFAMIEFSFVLYTKHALEQLAKEAARSASVGASADAVRTGAARTAGTIFPVAASSYAETTDAEGDLVGAMALTAADGRTIAVAFEPALSRRGRGETIAVAAEYEYPFFTPLLTEIGSLRLRSAYVTLVEYVPK